MGCGPFPGICRVSIFDMQDAETAQQEGGGALRPPRDLASMFDVMHQEVDAVNDSKFQKIC